MVLVDCGTMRQSQANYHILGSVKTHRMSLRHPMVSMALKTVFQDITNHSDRCSWWCLVLKTELAGVKSGRAYFTCFHNFLKIIPGLLLDRRNERPCTVWAPIWAKSYEMSDITVFCCLLSTFAVWAKNSWGYPCILVLTSNHPLLL